MGVHSMNDPDKFAIATQLYLRLKRNPGRIIDVAWLMVNEAYQREVIRVASETDAESAALAARLEGKPAKTRLAGSTTGNYTAAAIASETESETPASSERHYVGGLR